MPTRIVETGDRSPRRKAIVFMRRCETQTCRCCLILRRRKARKRAFKGAALPGRVFMWTLTIDPRDARWRRFRSAYTRPAPGRLHEAGMHGDDWSGYWSEQVTRASIRYVKDSWNRLATNLRRDPALREWLCQDPRTGKAVVPFHVSLELQRNGRAHLHVLVRVPSLASGFQHAKRLRELAEAAGFGPVMDWDAARSRAQLAAYVTKGPKVEGYVAKADELLPRHARRFSWSRSWCDWTPATRIAGAWDWRLSAAGPETVTRALEASGFRLDDPGRYRVTSAGGLVATPAGGA